jgi:SagB-type dehydrogenase family enzyme
VSAAVRSTAKVRRSDHLVGYWEEDRFVVHDFIAGTRTGVPPAAIRVLSLCATPQPVATVVAECAEFPAADVRRLVGSLVRRGLLRTVDTTVTTDGRSMAAGWRTWSPAAGFFHFTTKDARYPRGPADAERLWRQLGPATPMPAALKRYPGRGIPLPCGPTGGPFADVLLARRTWREFAATPVPLDRLATLLDLTWGVQRWATVRGQGQVALKTSPSGGARHSGEVYVLARRVAGLPAGLYHYDPAGRSLAPLRPRGRPLRNAEILPGQPWYRRAPVLLFMTAVFERAQWRYGFPRAYRAVLIEAGHLCQTCCLTATWLGLAPFCSMAFPDSAVERMIGLDGVTESMLYIAGAGMPPRRGWRPWSASSRRANAGRQPWRE